MDVSELRKRIIRALDDARKDAGQRRSITDEATRAYGEFLNNVAVPLLRQAVIVLKSEGQLFTVHTPADSVRLVSDKTPDTFLEIVLDTTTERPQILGRVSLARGRQGRMEERPLVPGKSVGEVTEEDVAQFLVRAVPKLVLRS